MKTAWLLAILALAATSAQAAPPRMPAELVGHWCFIDVKLPANAPEGMAFYLRCKRAEAERAAPKFAVNEITRDGYKGPLVSCKLTQSTRDPKAERSFGGNALHGRTYRMRFQCASENTNWFEESFMRLVTSDQGVVLDMRAIADPNDEGEM